MEKILCIGEALIDMICTDKGMPLQQGENFIKKAGGAPTNVAAAIGALGGSVSLLARVGSDPFGKHLVDVLTGFGVNTTSIAKDDSAFTTLAFVSLMEDGERDFYFSRGADANLAISDIETVNLNDYTIIHFGSATAFLPGELQRSYHYLLERAQEKKCFVSFDPNYRHLLFKDNQQLFIEKSLQFIKASDFVKLSDEEALLLTGTGTVSEAVAALRYISSAVFAITLGKEGTMFSRNDSVEIIPSIPVVVKDTTGAGDAFVGAVLYQLSEFSGDEIRNLPEVVWKQIIEKANKAGARTCEHFGAMEAFKHLTPEFIK